MPLQLWICLVCACAVGASPTLPLRMPKSIAGRRMQESTNSRVASISTGTDHTCAVMSDNKLKCWGYNQFGQLGYGDTVIRGDIADTMGSAVPAVDLGTDKEIKQVSLGYAHSCVLFVDGNLKCFGSNAAGQLGYGDTDVRGDNLGEMGRGLPYVDVGARVAQLASSGSSNCALLDTGDLKCWGGNSNGQLGYEDTRARGDGPGEMGVDLPVVNVGTGFNVTRVRMSFPQLQDNSHTCAILFNERVKCWGAANLFRLGYGDTVRRGHTTDTMGDKLAFVDLGMQDGAPLKVADLALTSAGTCALLSTGDLKCWGDSRNGQLGYGTETSLGTSQASMGDALPLVNVGEAVTQIGAGGTHVCILTQTMGTVKCWGNGLGGRLGYGNQVTQRNPSTLGGVSTNISTYAEIGIGFSHTCALATKGSVKCWGQAFWGQLGYGSTDVYGASGNTIGTNLPWVNLCDADEVLNTELGTCVYCIAGTVPATVNTGCVPCGPGTFAEIGEVTCKLCDRGYVRPDGVDGPCDTCPPGTIPGQNQTVCVPCPTGMHSARGATECITCTNNEVATAAGECVACQAGYIPDENRVACLPCDPGTAAAENETTCTPCTSGRYAAFGFAQCDLCLAGYAPDSMSSRCDPCPAGQYAQPGVPVCISCDDGEFSGEHSSECSACWPWHYVFDRDASDCSTAFIVFTAALLLQFVCLWFILGSYRGPIKITDITKVEGRLLVSCFRHHGVKINELTKMEIKIQRSGIEILDNPEETIVARGLDRFRLEILNLRNFEDVDVESSKGVLIPSQSLIRHCPDTMSSRWAYLLVGVRTVTMLVAPWLLMVFESSNDAGNSALIVVIGILIGSICAIVLSAKVWAWRTYSKTPLQRRFKFFRNYLKKQCRRSMVCAAGEGRGVTVHKLLEFTSIFKEFLAHRSTRYLIENIVKPLTSKENISLAEMVGPSYLTYYVASPEDTCFDEVVESIKRHSNQENSKEWRSLSYWIPALSVNFWDIDAENGNGVWRQSSMYQAMRSSHCRATCLVSSLDVSPLQRSWCLSETLETFRRQRDAPPGEAYQGLRVCTQRGLLGHGEESHFDHAISLGRSLAGFHTFDGVMYKTRDEDAALRHIISELGGEAMVFFKQNLWRVLETAEPDVYWDGICSTRESKPAPTSIGRSALRDAAAGLNLDSSPS